MNNLKFWKTRVAKQAGQLSVQAFFLTKTRESKQNGLHEVAKLVYIDNIPITKVVKSTTLRSLYKYRGYCGINYGSGNKEMDEQYERVIQKNTSAVKERPLEDLPVLAFDKWTAFDNTKFIGIYLYCAQKTYCLGLVNFTVFGGNEHIKELVQDRLGTFGPTSDDICVFIADCGADVKKMVQSIGAFHMPCLAHTVNLVAHKFLAHADAIEGEELWSPSESDEESENDTTKFNKLVHTARSFDQRIVNILHPLQVMTMEMQKNSANTETIIYVASYVRELAAQDDSLNGSITQVLEKHVSNNAVIHALTHKEGLFYNFVQTKLATAKSIKKRRDDQDKN